jgi:hypothetical protein
VVTRNPGTDHQEGGAARHEVTLHSGPFYAMRRAPHSGMGHSPRG